MRKTFILSAILLYCTFGVTMTCVRADTQVEQSIRYLDSADGKQVVFTLDGKSLRKSIWPPATETPALSAGKAAMIATKELARYTVNPGRYDVVAISLRKAFDQNCWYYEVDFLENSNPKHIGDHELPVFQIPVLLDGTTVVAKIEKR